MVTKYLTDVELPADFIHDALYRQGFTGYTDQQHQLYWFRHFVNTGADIFSYDASGEVGSPPYHAFYARAREELLNGHPLIHLRSFSGPNHPDGHFTCFIGLVNDHPVEADPWTGTRRVWTPQDYWAWSHCTYVRINRVRENKW